jgi:hypothetical protein
VQTGLRCGSSGEAIIQNISNGNHQSHRPPVFSRLQFGVHSSAQCLFSANSAQPCVLGKFQSVSQSRPHLSHPAPLAHQRNLAQVINPNRRGFTPRSTRLSVDHPVTGLAPSRSATPHSMVVGSQPRRFLSFRIYFHLTTCIFPPPPIVVLWSRSWHIHAPEFLDDDEEVPVIQAVGSRWQTSGGE